VFEYWHSVDTSVIIDLYIDDITNNVLILFSAFSPELMVNIQDGYICGFDHPLYPFWIQLNLVLMEK
jgi:hypothetical protein